MTDIPSSPLSSNDTFDYRSTKGANQGELNEKIGRKGDVIKILVKTLFCDFCHLCFSDSTRNPASPTPGPSAEAPGGGRALARLDHHPLPPLLLLPAS